jgi:hypothetical protein
VKSFAVELRVDGTLQKGEFRVQPLWDEAESGHTMVTARAQPSGSDASAGVNINDTIRETLETAESEQTVVRAKPKELYSVEVWRNGVREAVVPVVKSEITIGRGSRSVTVDLPIKGDPEVSRVHAELSRDNTGRYWVVPKGRNATLLNGRELPREEPTEVFPDQKISICTFILRIQPK